MGVFTRSNTLSPAPLAYSAPRTISASAQRVRLKNPSDINAIRARSAGASGAGGPSSWQRAAWDYYDLIAEIKYAFGLLGSVTSRIRLYPAAILDEQAVPAPLSTLPPPPAPTPTPPPPQPPAPPTPIAPVVPQPPPTAAPAPAPPSAAHPTPEIREAATTLLNRISSSRGGQPSLMRELAINLSVPGECYLVQEPAHPVPSLDDRSSSGAPLDREDWNIRSTDELVLDANNRPAIKSSPDARAADLKPLPPNAFVGRIWRSHPRYSDQADSSMRGVLDLCADLLLLTRAARATARSRLNAGAMYIPDGLSATVAPPEPPLAPDPANPPGSATSAAITPPDERDEFEEELITAMVTPITDDEAASAVVPLLIRGPAELADKIKQFKFERSFDPALAERADRILERILQGIDVPKDIVTGLANVRYSNAIAIDEALFKAHVEPLALLICDAITTIWIRPALVELGFPADEVNRITVWYDPSEVVMKPDKSQDADNGYDRYLISADAWRRSHGFTASDAPDGRELAYRMLVDKGQILPETAEMLLTKFAPEVMGALNPGLPPGLGGPGSPPAPAQTPGAPPAPEFVNPQAPGAPAPPAAAPPAPAAPEGLPPEVRQALGLPASAAPAANGHR